MSSVLRALASACLLCASASAQSAVRASVDSAGLEGDDASTVPAISADGRFLAFESLAGNLVPLDQNGAADVFVHDRATGITVRASLDSNGGEANDRSSFPALSADGRWVAFASPATNLVPLDQNGQVDLFVHDLANGTTTRASVSSGGAEATGPTLASALSSDGRRIAFASYASNLVPADTNSMPDVFVRDFSSGVTARASVSTGGAQGDSGSEAPALSADGRFVVFASDATNLVAGDTNGFTDVFLRNLGTGETARVSLRSTGAQILNGASYGPAISGDGSCVAFTSASLLVVQFDFNLKDDVFLRDLAAGTTELVSQSTALVQGNDHSWWPSLSADGRFVAFWSGSSNLVAGDTNGARDVFVRDRLAGTLARASLTSGNAQASGASSAAALSASGLWVAFESSAADLVPLDANSAADVFARSTPCGFAFYCEGKVNSQLCLPTLSATGEPSASAPASFVIRATEVVNAKSGLLLYGHAPWSAPFQGGILCVHPPLVRTPVQDSGGSAPPAADCSGVLQYDFNARIQSGVDPSLIAEAEIFAQYWYRDPNDFAGFATGLSDALRFFISP